jgi:hypothetical protein
LGKKQSLSVDCKINPVEFMAKKKSWLEKLKESKEPQIRQIDKPFANNPAGSTLRIPNPQLIEQYLKK